MGRKKIVGTVPTLEEVKAYWATFDGLTFTAERFFHYYNSTGWRIGNTRIVDWKSKFNNWVGDKSKSSTAAARPVPTCSSRPSGYRQTQMTAEERRQRLVAAETAIMEQKQREQAEREARLEEDRKKSVSYEEYVALRALNDES